MSIETYGGGERLRSAAAFLSAEIPSRARGHIVLLPIPTTKDNKHIFGTEIHLTDALCNVNTQSLVTGWGLPMDFQDKAKSLGAMVLDLAKDEEFVSENAYITAIGAAGYILQSTKGIPRDLSFGIVGYGRIGRILTEILLYLGADVTVYTSKESTRLKLGEYGVNAKDSGAIYGGVQDFSSLDILINTAPADIKEAFEAKALPSGLRVIELASGNNFEGIDGVENLPSLPEKMYPQSAGRAYFEAVKRYLSQYEE